MVSSPVFLSVGGAGFVLAPSLILGRLADL